MKLSSIHLKDLFFFAAIIFLAIFSFIVIKPFIGVIVLSLVLVEMFHPVHLFLKAKLKSESGAALLSTLLVIFLVIIPLVLIFVIAGYQALSVKDDLQNYIVANNLFENNGEQLTNQINNLFSRMNIHYTIERIDYEKTFLTIISSLAGTTSSILSILKNTINLFVSATFLIYTLYYFFKEHGSLRRIFKSMSPLEDGLDELFMDKFLAISKSVVKGSVIIGIIQAILGGLAFWVLGISAPLFWMLVMFFFALLPLGSGLVWVPASIILVLTGNVIEGIGLFLWGVLVISTIDNFLRPKLLQKDIELHPLISFFSVVGGIQVFGMLGLIYGPLIIILFLSLYETYRHKYKS